MLTLSVHASSEPSIPASRQIHDIVGVPTEGREALGLMEQYVARRLGGARDAQLEELVLRFADSVMRGVEPDLLGYVDRVDLRTTAWFVNVPGLDPRTGSMEAALKRQLTAMAEKRALTDPETARQLARAFMILRAHDRVTFGAGAYPQELGEHRLFDVAGLTAKQADELDALLKRLRDQHMACVDHYKATCDILMELMEDPQSATLWNIRLPEFIKQLRAGWPKCPDEMMIRYAFATHSWRVVCLARHYRIPNVEATFQPVLIELKNGTKDPVAIKWLDQILTLPGGIPDGPGVKVVTSPNEAKRGKP